MKASGDVREASPPGVRWRRRVLVLAMVGLLGLQVVGPVAVTARAADAPVRWLAASRAAPAASSASAADAQRPRRVSPYAIASQRQAQAASGAGHAPASPATRHHGHQAIGRNARTSTGSGGV